jgi:hypothetical protein
MQAIRPSNNNLCFLTCSFAFSTKLNFKTTIRSPLPVSYQVSTVVQYRSGAGITRTLTCGNLSTDWRTRREQLRKLNDRPWNRDPIGRPTFHSLGSLRPATLHHYNRYYLKILLSFHCSVALCVRYRSQTLNLTVPSPHIYLSLFNKRHLVYTPSWSQNSCYRSLFLGNYIKSNLRDITTLQDNENQLTANE